jgi:hypothetical protein
VTFCKASNNPSWFVSKVDMLTYLFAVCSGRCKIRATASAMVALVDHENVALPELDISKLRGDATFTEPNPWFSNLLLKFSLYQVNARILILQVKE